MAQFVSNGGNYSITGIKDGGQGDGIMSPQSPTTPGAAESGAKMGLGNYAILGLVGKQAVSQAIGMARSQIALNTGNERLQGQVNNAITGVQMAIAIVATKGLAAIGYAITGVTQAVERSLDTTRVNREAAYERDLRDHRIITTKSAYYE